MRPARVVNRVKKATVNTPAIKNLGTPPITRPVVFERAQNNRQEIGISKRSFSATSQAGASTSTSALDGSSQAEEVVGRNAEANEPEADLTGLPTSTDLLEVYRGMVARGRLAYDPEQVRIVMKVRPL